MAANPENWERFLPAASIETSRSRFASAYAGQTVCVAGAAGYIGSALSKMLAAEGFRRVVLLDSSEYGLFEIERQMQAEFPALFCHAVLGSIGDAPLLEELFPRFRPSIVFHAAAFKHVGLLEHNPFAAISNNTLGSYVLADAALRHGIPKLTLVSTDKAARPHSAMGVSKRIAELLTLSLNTPAFSVNALRLVNVIGSPGSVVPIFESQIARHRPVKVTDEQASRYFLSKHEAVDAILAAGTAACNGRILLPHVGDSVRIADLARFLTCAHKNGASAIPPLIFTGLRPGEKLTEDLIGEAETPVATIDGPLTVLETARIPREECGRIIKQLSHCCVTRNRAGLLETLRSLVPDYVPSALLRASSAPVLPGAR